MLKDIKNEYLLSKLQTKLVFCRYLLIARVAVGECHVGSQNTVVPNRKTGSLLRYDSTVDKMPNASIFVTYHDAQALPEYLVSFTEGKSNYTHQMMRHFEGWSCNIHLTFSL